jgi:hypothetical protein
VWRHGRRSYERSDVTSQSRALALLSVAAALTAVAAAIVVIVRL